MYEGSYNIFTILYRNRVKQNSLVHKGCTWFINSVLEIPCCTRIAVTFVLCCTRVAVIFVPCYTRAATIFVRRSKPCYTRGSLYSFDVLPNNASLRDKIRNENVQFTEPRVDHLASYGKFFKKMQK